MERSGTLTFVETADEDYDIRRLAAFIRLASQHPGDDECRIRIVTRDGNDYEFNFPPVSPDFHVLMEKLLTLTEE